MSNEDSIQQGSQENTDQLHLNRLTTPTSITHVKPGNTLCSNNNVLLVQDGSTTIEFRLPPKFQPKRIPWRFGLVRDIVWSSDLDLFILLTRDALFSISPKPLFAAQSTLNKPLADFKINKYDKIKPYDSNTTFWRCTCAGKTLYILYSGYGTVIDEYSIRPSSCTFVGRSTPPNTCAPYEGIWCIRYHPDTDQLGLTVMDARTNQWRIEVRSRDKLALLWQLVLPLTHGDCEISPLPSGEWLAVNSCGIRLVQVADQKLKAAVEYERELKNAVAVNNLYFAVRTKSTLEIHEIKLLK